jgi:hypothetical protein
MDKRPVALLAAVFCLFMSGAAFGEDSADVAEGGFARISADADGTISLFYTELDNTTGAPAALVKAKRNPDGSWSREVIVSAPDFVPSGQWEIAVLANDSYLLGMSLPRAATKRGLTPAEAEWGRIVVPTFFHIKPLKISEEDRARLGVTKKNSCGPVDGSPYINLQNGSTLGDFLVENGSDVIILADGYLGLARCGRFVTLEAPVAASGVRQGRVVRIGKELIILSLSTADGKTSLQRISTADGKQFSTPITAINEFEADEYTISASGGVISLVYLRKDADEKHGIYRRISSDGGKSWSVEEMIYETENPVESLDSASGTDGSLNLTWVEKISGKRVVKYKKIESADSK